ncbi:unnamed protein product [Peronospora belbahrii]|uniref:J domain-containing protein n=1 Tax=Peronospora belbahrii TaxID=622444 RepID=A0AAU9KXL8_9STRA|nr:unnamed protein product [Peronospora belbahrii]CAH0517218.1 unnamed protein product [Peronospora belbahrii]
MDKKHLQPNYYDILGVDRSASTEDIKAAYRKLVLKHHPDRNHVQTKSSSVRQKDEKDAEIVHINAAYDLLSDDSNRVKYDMEMFGVSAIPNYNDHGIKETGSYKPMSSQDVHEMLGGLNTYERFTTAQFHRHRSHIAPSAIGRRATNLMERKRFRAANSKLPTQSVSLAWLAFPIALMASRRLSHVMELLRYMVVLFKFELDSQHLHEFLQCSRSLAILLLCSHLNFDIDVNVKNSCSERIRNAMWDDGLNDDSFGQKCIENVQIVYIDVGIVNYKTVYLSKRSRDSVKN